MLQEHPDVYESLPNISTNLIWKYASKGEVICLQTVSNIEDPQINIIFSAALWLKTISPRADSRYLWGIGLYFSKAKQFETILSKFSCLILSLPWEKRAQECYQGSQKYNGEDFVNIL